MLLSTKRVSCSSDHCFLFLTSIWTHVSPPATLIHYLYMSGYYSQYLYLHIFIYTTLYTQVSPPVTPHLITQFMSGELLFLPATQGPSFSHLYGITKTRGRSGFSFWPLIYYGDIFPKECSFNFLGFSTLSLEFHHMVCPSRIDWVPCSRWFQ